MSLFVYSLRAIEYRELKGEIKENISKLTSHLSKINSDKGKYIKLIDDCFKLMANLEMYYLKGDTGTKQLIVSLIFPFKLVFKINSVQTLNVNELIPLICSNNGTFGGDKKEKLTEFGKLSLRVVAKGFKPLAF